MNTTESSIAGRMPRAGFGRLIVRLMLLAVVASIVAGAYLYWSTHRRLSARLAAIRARGEPTTFGELAALYPTPALADDTTQDLLRAGRELRSAAQSRGKALPFVGEVQHPTVPHSPWADSPAAREYLKSIDAPLQELHQAIARGAEAKFDIFDARTIREELWLFRGIIMRFQHTERHSALLYGVRTLRLEAAACAAEGQTRKAAEALCAAVRLQRAIENEPREESQRSRIEIMNFATEELWRLLPYVEFSEDDLARLQREIDSIEFHSSCRLALLSDRVAGIAILDDPQSFGVPRNVAIATRPFRAADEEFYLGVMADYIAAAELPFPELLARTEAVTRIVEQDSSMSHVLSRMLLSPEQGIARYTCRTELQRRMLVLALALERYRRRNGHAAPDLAALVPEYLADVPTDPTSGKAFEYKSQPDGAGYVLFSPTQKFSLPTGDKLDAETGANPLLVFRYPPLAETAPDGADEEARTESVTEQ